MSRLQTVDVALLADGAVELPRATATRVEDWIRTLPECAEVIRDLEEMADVAGLVPHAEERLCQAENLSRDLERLHAGEWADPAEVLDPNGTEGGVDLPILEALLALAEWKRQQAGTPRAGEVVEKLKEAIAAKQADADVVTRFVNGLQERGRASALQLLRDAVRQVQQIFPAPQDEG